MRTYAISIILILILSFFAPVLALAHVKTAKATFAGGCYWCVEEVFDGLKGVISATSGFATSRVEAVEIMYNPDKISYEKLLELFWKNIDPTDSQGQFCDRGAQYTSAIFYHDDEQRRLAEASKAKVATRFKQPIHTQIAAAGAFYKAEDYHQDYYRKNPLRYNFYRSSCGRDARLEELWGSKGSTETN